MEEPTFTIRKKNLYTHPVSHQRIAERGAAPLLIYAWLPEARADDDKPHV